MIKKLFSILFCLSIITLLFPMTAYAETSKLTVTVGTSGTYAALGEVFADISLEGDVTVSLMSDVTDTVTDTPLIVPDRFSSLTVQSSDSQKPYRLCISQRQSSMPIQGLFANGKNLTINVPISKASFGGNVYIFGGGFNRNVSASPVITVNAAVTGRIFSGGFNSDLT